jgi:hypothetical protein
LFDIQVPPSLAGRPLRESGIGSRTGLSVVALQMGDHLQAHRTAETPLRAGASLLILVRLIASAGRSCIKLRAENRPCAFVS